jgi:cytochrome P450
MRKLWFDRLSLLGDAAREYGDAVRFRMGPKTLYYFNHPDYAKHVLADNSANYHKGMGLTEARRLLGDGSLTSDGDVWRRHRRAIQPQFRREPVADLTELIAAEADALIGRLESGTGGGPVDVVAEMTHLTLGVLGRGVLDADLTRFGDLGAAFEAVQDQAMFEMVTLGILPIWLPLRRHRRFRMALRVLEDAAFEIIDGHQDRGGDTGHDFIGGLASAYRDEPDTGLARTRIRDELLTILLAGHETTASTLSWLWHLLGAHPEIADRVAAEAADVLGDSAPRHADLQRLRYTAMVLQEAMRLYPPVWALTRRAVAADNIGGYHVPAGADVMVSPYTLHRHPAFWPDPGRFDPARFDPARGGPAHGGPAADGTAHRYAYIPFGAGPRVCVGSHLGTLEATLVTAMVARRFRLQPVPGRQAGAEAMLSLRPRGGLPMIVRERFYGSHPRS